MASLEQIFDGCILLGEGEFQSCRKSKISKSTKVSLEDGARPSAASAEDLPLTEGA